MNRQIKLILTLTILVASTVGVAYAAQNEPNMPTLIQMIYDYLTGNVTPALNDIDSDLESHQLEVQQQLDALESRVAGIPVMESVSGQYSNSELPASTTPITVYNRFYPSTATIQVTLAGGVTGEGAAVGILASINGDMIGTFGVGGINTDVSSSPTTVSFTADRCWITVYTPHGGTVNVWYAVTATYIP